MSESKSVANDEFWLFHDLEKEEVVELRKFFDPKLDLKSVEGIDKIIDRLYHLLD